MASPSPIPSPRPDDDEDVHWALSTASALWARGDGAESIKWLRRAAETASDQNCDQRSLELFKAAADATSIMQRSATPAAPLPVPPPAPLTQAPQPIMSPPLRPPMGPSGTLSIQLPLAPPQSPVPPPVRPSARAPQPQPSPPARAPLPQRPAMQPASSAGPPAGTARAAATSQVTVPRAGAPSPGFSSQRPAGVSLTATAPGAIIQARGVLKQTLPSEGANNALPIAAPRVAVPAARPSPGTGGAGAVPSSAAKRADSRKRPLDDRFHFPDEEVTVQRDLAALKRPIAINAGVSADDAAAAAATVRAPPTGATPPVTQTIISGVAPKGLGSPRPEIAPSPVAAPVVNEATSAEPDHGNTPIDDLDEQTSVLQGDEAELDFSGSATGESSAALLDSLEKNELEHDNGSSDVEDPVTGEDSSDLRGNGVAVPSIRPDPMPRIDNPIIHGAGGQSSWTALRVAVRRDASGVRIEAIARGAHLPPGAIGAVLVAQDDESAAALVRLLDS